MEYDKVYFMDEDDDLNGVFFCSLIYATSLLNLCAELSECYTKQKCMVWVNLHIYVPQAQLFVVGIY